MRITLDNPAAAPAPVGPYSHVARVELDGLVLLFISGQVAVDDIGHLTGGDSMADQTRRVFENIAAILAAHGASFSDVINIRTYLADMARVREYGTVRRKYLTGEPPTSTTVEVSRLFLPGALLEVEAISAVSTDRP